MHSGATTFDHQSPLHLAGRAREQAVLRQCLDDVVQGRGRLVLIGGEAGIGKTSLADDLLQQTRDSGARTLAGGCYDLTTTPPYGPWLEIVQAARTLGDVPSDPPALDDVAAITDAGSQAAIFDAMRVFLAAAAAERPLAVLLEDLHWADPTSLDLLRYLARQVRDRRLLLVATYREDEITRRHPLALLLPRMTREAQAVRLHLRPLDNPALHELVAARYALPPADERRLVAHLADLSEGNPFFAQALLGSLEENGLLTDAGDRWALGALPATHMPPLIQEVVEARLVALPDDVRELLEAAALLGHEVLLDSWQRLTEVTIERLSDVVDRALAAHVLVVGTQPDRLRFTHALVREVLVEGITPLQRRAWHRRVAETLLAMGPPDPDAMAYHLRQAGDAREAEWQVRAGLRAERAYAAQTAAERYEAALRLLGSMPERRGQCGWLEFRLGCVRRISHPREALDYFRSASRTGERITDAALEAFALYGEGLVRFNLGETERGAMQWRDGIEKLEALPDEDRRRIFMVNEAPRNFWPDAMPDAFGIAEGRNATSSGLVIDAIPTYDVTGRASLAGQLAEVGYIHDALALLEPLEGLDERWWTSVLYGNRGVLYCFVGRPDDAHEEWQRYLRDRRNEPTFRLLGISELLEMLILPYHSDYLGERAELAAIAAEASDIVAESLPSTWTPGVFSLPLDVLEGRWRHARDSTATVDWDAGRPNWGQMLRAHVGEIAAFQGDRPVFEAQRQAVLPDGPETVPGTMQIISAMRLQRLSANLAIFDGDLAGARAWLEAHDRWLEWSRIVLGRADGLLGWAAYHFAAGALQTARRAAEQSLEAAASPRQPLVLLGVERLFGQLDGAEGRHDDA